MTEEHAEKVRQNGALGGCPLGTEKDTKTTYPADEMIEATATAIMSGKRSPLTLPTAGPVTESDMRNITRAVGMPAEMFISKLTDRLQSHAIRVSDRIGEKLEGEPDKLKLNDLTFLLSVCVDKLQAIGNRQSTQGAAVGTQINIFAADSSRAAMLAGLKAQQVGQVVDVRSSAA